MFVTAGKSLAILLLSLVTVLALFSVSPVYDFTMPGPFRGPDIFNPYSALDTAVSWKRANFHTHTKVKSVFNECDYWPGEVYDAYSKFGYDIVTFSNHNALTVHPFDSTLQVNVYEHGYNLFKYHLLVFGSDRVGRFDPLLPILTSQRQWKLDILGKNADFIQLNHPFRTNLTSRDDMECLTGYRIIELDSGVTTEQEYWDWALSAGHYSFALANDDLHYPDRSDRIAVRCNMLCCDGADYGTLKSTLLSGAYYCMRIPDFGGGDWEVKYAENKRLPQISDIGLKTDTAYVKLSRPAVRIKATGQDGKTLASVEEAKSMCWKMHPEDSYVRFTAYFDDGVVIYTNPFARYDASKTDSPYAESAHSVNAVLTILYNLLVLVVAAGCMALIILVARCGRKGER